MYLGLDLGTSGVKAVLVDDNQAVVGSGSAALEVSRPQPVGATTAAASASQISNLR